MNHPSVIIIGPAYPLRGGLSSFNERLARQFKMEGSNCEIFTFSLQYPSFLFPGKTQYSSDPAPDDLNIHVCINSVNPMNWIRVGQQIKKIKPDLIVVRYWLPFMGPCLGTMLRMVKKNGHTRIICIADNVIPHEKRVGDKLFTTYFLKAVDGFVTMSEKVLSDLKQFTDKPATQVIHPLYDNFGEKLAKQEARKHLQLNPSKDVLLFFGFIRKYKGLDLLLEAIAMLKDSNYLQAHPIFFLIAGEMYENPQPYLDLIERLGIQQEVILNNEFIADSEVKYYLSAADGVIQPYTSATQSGVTPLAYHFECPMIVTNVGGLPALVPETIGMVTEPNPQAIAQAIRDFFAADRLRFEANIKIEKKKYGWDKITQAIVSLANISKI